ncbi:hypothetical protein CC85DRAFT_139552 [Cutaneotrichosporon oleaginosum]|uniref:Uncharacterized protein n=1 Tax=Cutaneotrichosporon oleaginosum TaxID=879819 RepID=A0A0J0XIH2_9TREE|nr:uncharacterized protein CC85DRAFT_139552 [Cutaneotrichosporon oleaginosum]KLT40883.1 hypothetical protein CC85DRAFT_139552 [Cutaneotrichosporon oleaginosum]TXT09258.1 hypothetical protein COLE_03192 [Cutaneotrichosporon oleaginosum]
MSQSLAALGALAHFPSPSSPPPPLPLAAGDGHTAHAQPHGWPSELPSDNGSPRSCGPHDLLGTRQGCPDGISKTARRCRVCGVQARRHAPYVDLLCWQRYFSTSASPALLPTVRARNRRRHLGLARSQSMVI